MRTLSRSGQRQLELGRMRHRQGYQCMLWRVRLQDLWMCAAAWLPGCLVRNGECYSGPGVVSMVISKLYDWEIETQEYSVCTLRDR